MAENDLQTVKRILYDTGPPVVARWPLERILKMSHWHWYYDDLIQLKYVIDELSYIKMDAVTEFTMAIDTKFNSILNEIQLSKLNFAIQITPFAAYITLKKSTQVDKNGAHAIPSPPLFQMLQQAYRELSAVKEDNAHLRQTLKLSEQKCENLDTVNASLFKKLNAADSELTASRDANDSLGKKIEDKDKEILKLRQLKKDLEDNVKLQLKDQSEYTFETNAKIKSLNNAIGIKDKETHNLNKIITNQHDTVSKLKTEVSKLKIRESKLEKEKRKQEKELANLKIRKKQISVHSQTSSTDDTPYCIAEPLPPIFGSQLCTQSKPIFMTKSLPDVSKVVLVNVTEDDILQEAAEEALNAQYDREIATYYEEAKLKATRMRELYDENAIGELFAPNLI